jgi:hypothetical protein
VKIALIVLGVLIVLASGACAAGGGVIATIVGTDGRVQSSSERISTTTSAIVSEVADIAESDPQAADAISLANIELRVRAESATDQDAFIGIARAGDVDRYLADVSREIINDIEFDPDFRIESTIVEGDDQPETPADRDFWVASVTGPGQQTLDWEVVQGAYRLVFMNADGSEGVEVDASLGVKIPFAFQIGLGLLITGIIFAIIGVAIIVLAVRSGEPPPPVRPQPSPAPPPPTA